MYGVLKLGVFFSLSVTYNLYQLTEKHFSESFKGLFVFLYIQETEPHHMIRLVEGRMQECEHQTL